VVQDSKNIDKYKLNLFQTRSKLEARDLSIFFYWTMLEQEYKKQ